MIWPFKRKKKEKVYYTTPQPQLVGGPAREPRKAHSQPEQKSDSGMITTVIVMAITTSHD